MSVIWHDLECGGYAADLPLWRELADREGDPVLEVGAGTGRVAVDLARRGHRLIAIDHDPELIAELQRRAEGLELNAVQVDARTFEFGALFALCLVPMQTIQLLGGTQGRAAFLKRAARHLRSGGLLAVAITEQLDTYDSANGGPHPLPDICERDGVVYASQPTAIRGEDRQIVLERRRETVNVDGQRVVTQYSVGLDRLTSAELEREMRAAGLTPSGHATIAATRDYAGSEVVMARA